jgi:hypothetical protein
LIHLDEIIDVEAHAGRTALHHRIAGPRGCRSAGGAAVALAECPIA